MSSFSFWILYTFCIHNLKFFQTVWTISRSRR